MAAEYAAILLFFLAVAVFLEIKYKIHLYHSLKERIIFPLGVMTLSVIWDYFAVSRQHWIFPGPGLIGIRIYGLPIEEFMFFFIAPYLLLTLYKLADKKIKWSHKKHF